MTETALLSSREEEIEMLREWLPDLAVLDKYLTFSPEDEKIAQQNLDALKIEPRHKLGLVY